MKDQLVEVKEKELELRNEICDLILDGKVKGTSHFKKFGLDAAAVAKENVKIDKDVLKTIFKKLSPQEKACIKYKPELINKEYKNLPENSIFHQAVVTTPGTPALTIKPIK